MTRWSVVYVGIAILFGVGVWVFGGRTTGAEYFAGYVTGKALSVDNLFLFLIIMTSFKVPRADQQKVLPFGVVFSLVARSSASSPSRCSRRFPARRAGGGETHGPAFRARDVHDAGS